MAEVFADGEPVDPIKLQKLQDQILAIELKANQAFSLSSRNVESGSQQYVYHTQAGVESFSNVTGSAEPKTGQIELAWGSEYDQVYTVATPRLKNPKLDIRVTFTGDSRQPTMVVYYNAPSANKLETLNVHWVSVARKLVTE